MKVFMEREDRHIETEFSGTVAQLLEQLEVNPETVIVTKNNALVTEQEELSNSDDVGILTVISGG